MSGSESSSGPRPANGFSVIELVVALAIIIVVSAFSVPQFIGARRALRAASIATEIVSEMRKARQMAMAQRRAVTLQYDDTTKRLNVINHGADANGVGFTGAAVLLDPNYPNTNASTVVASRPLAGGGAATSEITYGKPPTAPTSANNLDDRTTLSALNASRQVNITFQPDGRVIDGTTQQPSDFALSFYNSVKPTETARAVSVLGGTGRIKAWRYSSSANKYVE